MAELWFNSDLHFGHRFMARLRGYEEDVELHDEMLVDAWNTVIGPKDDVWTLGDFSFLGEREGRRLFHRLNGRHKKLARGNHDAKKVVDLPWSEVVDFTRVSWDGHKVFVCHYPMLTWPNAHHGVWHLHGHSHGHLSEGHTTRMDVGVDATSKIALNADEVVEIMERREYDFIDHHGTNPNLRNVSLT